MFESISTMSMAASRMSYDNVFVLRRRVNIPIVGMSAITTRRREFARLVSSSCVEAMRETNMKMRTPCRRSPAQN